MDIKGFKVNFLGDSITEGVGVENQQNRYDNILKDACGLSDVNNYSISGSRLAHQIHPSEKPRYDLCFCGRAYDMDESADMVIVYGGVNDYIHGDAPFGSIGDKTPATFCGGVYFLMNYLRETYGEKPIIFLTPARSFLRKEVDDRIVSTHAKKLPGGKPLIDYADAIIETAKGFNVHVPDLYRNLGIDPHDEEVFDKYTTDGLHFNDEGHKVLARFIKEYIEAI
ncbi:MAG: SGNH/GDSL hydrolase family protein [Clostridia bacterium]|nr:SGNH/GDSL hydrolase family protein [Clostridia bacterium]MBQ9121727.1 SGNH/GDSL hydrolase family protein [Clostridia bacterium]